MTDTHDGVQLKPGLHQLPDGSLCMCLLELLRNPQYKGNARKAVSRLLLWVHEAMQKGYAYAGATEPFHLYFSAPVKEAAK